MVPIVIQFVHVVSNSANTAHSMVTPLSRHLQETNICNMSWSDFQYSWKNIQFSVRIFLKILQMNYFLPKIKNWNTGQDILEILLPGGCLVSSIKIAQAMFPESCTPWPHMKCGAVHPLKLAFYCRDLQCHKTICNNLQWN